MTFKKYIEDQINNIDEKYFDPDSYQAIAVIKRGFMKELFIQIKLLPGRVFGYLIEALTALCNCILYLAFTPFFIVLIPFIPLIVTARVYFRALKILKKEYKKEG